MSWYRSYLQESGLYSTSPPGSLPAPPNSNAPRPGSDVAAGGLGGLPQQAQDPGQAAAQQGQQMKSAVQTQQQQQQHDEARQQGSIRAAPAPAGQDTSLLALTAALEAAWAGGGVTSPDSTPSSSSSNTGVSTAQACPQHSAAQHQAVAKQQAARHAADRASQAKPQAPPSASSKRPAAASVQGGRADKGCAGAGSPLVMHALPPQACCLVQREPAPPAATAAAPPAAPAAAAASSEIVPADPLPETTTPLGRLPARREQHKQQQQQQQHQQAEGPAAAAAPAAGPTVAGSPGCPQAAAVAAAAGSDSVGGSGREDPLGFDWGWEGPGLRRRLGSGTATNTNSGSSGRSSLAKPQPQQTPQQKQQQPRPQRRRQPPPPRQQQQQQQQSAVAAADDSWEALVSSMRQCHPDNVTPAGQPAAAGAAAGTQAAPSPRDLASGADAVQAAGLTPADVSSVQQQQQQRQGAKGHASPRAVRQLPPPPAPLSKIGAAAAAKATVDAAVGTDSSDITDLVQLPSAFKSSDSSSSSSSVDGRVKVKPRGSSGGCAPCPLSPRGGAKAAAAPIPFLSGFATSSSSSCGAATDQVGCWSPRGSASTHNPLAPRTTSSSGAASTQAQVTVTTPLLCSVGSSSSSSSAGSVVGGAGPLSPRSGSGSKPVSLPGLGAPPSSRKDAADPTQPLLLRAGSSSSSARGRASSSRGAGGGSHPVSPRFAGDSGGGLLPLLRSSSSSSTVSSLQLAALGPRQASGASGGVLTGSSGGGVGIGVGGRSLMQSVALRPLPNRPMGWWVCGGLAVAAVAGGAMAAVYGVMTYFFKVSMMYSLAWKAATGVAAAEGLAIGGWSCKTVRVQQAEAAKSAAETARLRQQAAHELAALRALLQQHEASHTHEVGSLAALNERLTRLTHSLQAEVGDLQGALDRAAADRKALEAAAALEVKRAETSALVGVTADATGRVAGRVEQLSRGQQQLVALVQELREDLMGLVTTQEGTGPGGPGDVGQAAGDGTAGEAEGDLDMFAAVLVRPGCPPAGMEEAVTDSSSSSSSNVQSSAEAAGCGSGAVGKQQVGHAGGVGGGVLEGGPVRVSSVRGGVQAAMAATVCGTLEL